MRSFARLYNEIKHKPRAYERVDPSLRKRFRMTHHIQDSYRLALKQMKKQFPEYQFSDIVKSSKEQIKAFFNIPSLRMTLDESQEKKLLTGIKKYSVDPVVEANREYLEENLFYLDRSLESRRNVLLIEEVTQTEKAYRQMIEEQRRKQISTQDPQAILGSSYTKYLSVNSILDGVPSKEIALNKDVQHISSKGVISLPSKPGKKPTFEDLDHQQLQAYIVYNLENTEQAVGMYKNSLANPFFNNTLKSLLIQKLCLLGTDPNILKWAKSIDLNDLDKKNTVDTLWTLTFRYKTDLPANVKSMFISSCLSKVHSFNSMNLAYFADSLLRLRHFSEECTTAIEKRYSEILQSVDVPAKKTTSIPYFELPLKGHSIFCNHTDWTIPSTPLPAFGIIKTLKYLYKSSSSSFPDIINQSAQVLEYCSLHELSIEQQVEAIQFFGTLPEIFRVNMRSLVIELGKLTYDDFDMLDLSQMAAVGEGLMNVGEFRMSGLFRLLISRCTELAGLEDTNEGLVRAARVISRFLIACNYGIDCNIEPFFWLKEVKFLPSEFFKRIVHDLKKLELDAKNSHILCYYGGLVGHEINYSYDESIQSLINTAVLRLKMPNLEPAQAMIYIMNEKNMEKLSELLVALSLLDAEIDWKTVGEYANFVITQMNSQPHKVAIYWALSRKGIKLSAFEVEKSLLTPTEEFLLNE